MKKEATLAVSFAASVFVADTAVAADLPAKAYTKSPAVEVYNTWDIAFGATIMSDYVVRGVTMTAHGRKRLLRTALQLQ